MITFLLAPLIFNSVKMLHILIILGNFDKLCNFGWFFKFWLFSGHFVNPSNVYFLIGNRIGSHVTDKFF